MATLGGRVHERHRTVEAGRGARSLADRVHEVFECAADALFDAFAFERIRQLAADDAQHFVEKLPCLTVA